MQGARWIIGKNRKFPIFIVFGYVEGPERSGGAAGHCQPNDAHLPTVLAGRVKATTFQFGYKALKMQHAKLSNICMRLPASLSVFILQEIVLP
jgi:hypothetical protein